VKINGFAINTGVLKTTDLLRIGNSIWKSGYEAVSAEAPLVPGQKSIHQHFGGIMGIEGLQNFKLKDIFSSIFKKHTLAETEEQLITGTSKNIPAITEIETSWAKPWLFSRFILIAAILTILLILGVRMFENIKLIPGIIFVGAFAMPIASLIFFVELNAPRNVSIFLVFLLVFIGGVGSLLITLLIHSNLHFISKTFGAAGAGFVEEPAKLLIVIWVMGKYLRYKWLLNGLLFGAAVGTGFAAFESAGYALESLLDPRGLNFDAMVESIKGRGFMAGKRREKVFLDYDERK
jgi:RsiW-degrading membrane proteinase PrsW (M82 family)